MSQESKYYHQSIKFKKNEPAYRKLLKLQDSLLDPTGKKYPLTSIIKMSIMTFNEKESSNGN